MKSINLFNPYAWFWLVITLVEYLWLDMVSQQPVDFNTVSWIITLNLLGQLLTLSKQSEPMISFFTAFIVFYYVFHFGQVVLLGLFPKYEYDYLNYVTSYMTNGAVLHETLKLCIVSINMFFVGGLFLKHLPMQKNVSIECEVNKKNVGKTIFYFLFPFRIGLDAVQVAAAIIGGYEAANIVTNMVPGYMATLANMWYAVVPLYYLELKTKPERKRFILLVVLYMVMTMVTGNRGHQMVGIVSLFIVVVLLEQRITARQWVKYMFIAIVGMFFIDVIYDLRNMGINAFFKDYSGIVENSASTNIILETLGTFGETVYTPYLVVEGYGNVYHSFFGECFLKSIFSIVPDVTGGFKDINNQAIFQKQLGTESAIGGSFCGEMYYNFGLLYPLLSLIIGFIFAKVSFKICQALKSGRYYKLMLLLPFAVLFIWWVRDSIGNMTRQVVWFAIMIYFLKSKLTTRYILGTQNNK